MPTIIDTLNSFPTCNNATSNTELPIRAVPPSEWMEKLRVSASIANAVTDSDAASAVNSALKLIDFYQDKLGEIRMPVCETGKAEAGSEALRKWVPSRITTCGGGWKSGARVLNLSADLVSAGFSLRLPSTTCTIFLVQIT